MQLSPQHQAHTSNYCGESDTVKECFLVIQRGLYIDVFKYHARQEDPEGIPNFQGCVSLTQAFGTGEDMPYIDEDIISDEDTWNYNPMDKIDQSLQPYVKFDDAIIPQYPKYFHGFPREHHLRDDIIPSTFVTGESAITTNLTATHSSRNTLPIRLTVYSRMHKPNKPI